MNKVALTLLMILPCVAQTPGKYSARVKLTVEAANEDLKDRVNSFLGRELRSLGDVAIVDDKPDFDIHVLASQTVKPGVVVSVATVVFAPLSADSVTATLRLIGKIDDSQFKVLRDYMKDGSRILDVSLLGGDVSDVQNFCKQIIVDFDSRQLDPERKLWSHGFKAN